MSCPKCKAESHTHPGRWCTLNLLLDRLATGQAVRVDALPEGSWEDLVELNKSLEKGPGAGKKGGVEL